MKKKIHVLIMAGGKGERFWPQSRNLSPKQFLNLNGPQSLFEQTISRIQGWVAPSNIWVLTNSKHVPLVRKLAPKLKKQNVIGEPIGKDTAPCIAVASSLIHKKDPKGVMVVLPADHLIASQTKFKQILLEAAQLASTENCLITLGIRPKTPHTGYGYIQMGKQFKTTGKNQFYQVKAFKEKPNRTTALKYLKSGRFYWNSGIFVWRADVILANLRKFLPKIARGAQQIAASWGTKSQNKVLRSRFQSFQKISIDFGVMEKAKKVVVGKAPFQWDDLGSWSSLAKYLPKDGGGNAFSGKTLSQETKNCVLFANNGLVATLGVSNLIVVRTPDVTLVATKDKEQQIKELLSKLSQKKDFSSFL